MCAVPGSPEVEVVFAKYGKTDEDCPFAPSVPLTPLKPDVPEVPFPPVTIQFAPLLVINKLSY
jgi:hypothetical protein